MTYPALWRARTPSAWDNVFDTRRELDRVLDRFFTVPASAELNAWAPPVDVQETADEILVQAELAGMRREDVTVSIEDNVLTLTGEKKSEAREEPEASGYRIAERRYGRFERSFTLPRTVDTGGISARFADGVLTVSLPKAEAAKPRRVAIDVAAN